MSLGRAGARAALALLGALTLSAMLATSAWATTLELPAGDIAFVRQVRGETCNGVVFGYQLDAGPKTQLPGVGCGEYFPPPAEIGPFKEAHKLRFYLTDNACGFTFFSDGTEHATVLESNPAYKVQLWDGGEECQYKPGVTDPDTPPASLEFTEFAGTHTTTGKTLEFGQCKSVAAGTGLYGNNACTKLGGERKYEWGAFKPKPTEAFELASEKTEGPVVFESVGKNSRQFSIVCPAVDSIVLIAGEKEVVMPFGTAFFGCNTGALEVPCTTPGAGAGTIQTTALMGEPGIILTGTEPTKDKDGLLFNSEQFPGTYEEFSCGGVPVVAKDEVIGSFPTNVMASKFTLKFSQSGGIQKPTEFVGEGKEALEVSAKGRAFEAFGQAFSTVLGTAKGEKIELRDCKPDC